jgi:predicted metal-dependent phosphoesterase TrpH
MTKLCDLHCHSTNSDGSDTPSKLIEIAHSSRLSAIALTDHDTIAGIDEAYHESQKFEIDFINGIELSIIFRSGNMHILGYLYNAENEEFLKTITLVHNARVNRNKKILDKLSALGMPIKLHDLEIISGGGEIGRPHFARIMLEYGYVKSLQMAFDLYLKKGAPAYEPKALLTPAEAINIIHNAGGVAVLAHPITLNLSLPSDLIKAISDLKEAGLDGIECRYPEHDTQFTRELLELCKKFDLVSTGGSDYHGKAKPTIKLGKGKGSLAVPYECVINLKKRREKIHGL